MSSESDSLEVLSLQGRMTYPVRFLTAKSLEDPIVVQECLEHVMYAQQTYRIQTEDGKDVLMLPITTPESFSEIEISLPEETVFALSLEAHRRDITLNQLITIILMREIEKSDEQESTVSGT